MRMVNIQRIPLSFLRPPKLGIDTTGPHPNLNRVLSSDEDLAKIVRMVEQEGLMLAVGIYKQDNILSKAIDIAVRREKIFLG